MINPFNRLYQSCAEGRTNRDHYFRLRADLGTPGLSNLAATVLNLLGFEAPADYDASLIEPA